MNIKDLQNQIKNKQLDDLYIFVGENSEIEKQYINKISEVSGFDIVYAYYYSDVYSKICSDNLFNSKYVYVILYDEQVIKEDLEYIKSNGNILIFKYIELDKRTKFYKNFENRLVHFDKLSEELLIKYIRNELQINESRCKILIDMCDNDYDRILLELDKLKNYISYFDVDKTMGPMEFNVLFDTLNSNNVFNKEIDDITFNFVDAIVTKNDAKVCCLLNDFKKNCDNSYIGFLSLLYNNIKTILLIQSCHSNDIAKTTGLSNGQIFYNKSKINKYSTEKLIEMMQLIYKLDCGIKRGLIEENVVLDYFLVNVF